jgi:hypothetical protein
MVVNFDENSGVVGDAGHSSVAELHLFGFSLGNLW